jgi:hypothetical protein
MTQTHNGGFSIALYLFNNNITCYNCIYSINMSGGKCMLVEDTGSDVLGKVSDVIAQQSLVNSH